MSARHEGPQDTDVLMRLRQFGLHPAVRVFECDRTRTWTKQSFMELVSKAADHAPMLRIVIGNRTA
jgi:hypothetical protein